MNLNLWKVIRYNLISVNEVKIKIVGQREGKSKFFFTEKKQISFSRQFKYSGQFSVAPICNKLVLKNAVHCEIVMRSYFKNISPVN